MFFDTHCHLNSKAFSNDADEVIRRALAEATWMNIIGLDYKSSKKALELANRFESGVYAAVGLHPTSLFSFQGEDGETIPAEVFSLDMYQVLADMPKTVAIGEIGLDYAWHGDEDNIEQRKELQQKVFRQQLELALNYNLPVIIHCRQAHDDLWKIIEKFRADFRERLPKDKPWGVVHCFSADENTAWNYFNAGLIISFTGLITFSQRWDDLIRKVPLDKMMIETDAPYMTPEPHRGKRNEPVLVKRVAERMAQIRGVSEESIAQATTENARRLFGV
ncbi:MAG: TatD family hydrolase [Patescibacteria group bacterium]|nr:MAG: TatD family hydrolase [Patescibacteria group bacterium]